MSRIKRRKALLLLFQIDHLSGEEMGHLIETLYIRGAYNVQVISTLTKKNRPGFIVLADIGAGDDERLMEGLAPEFAIAGYHRIETTHCHLPMSSGERKLTLRKNGRKIQATIRFKQFGSEGAPSFIRAEYEDLRQLKERLQEAFGLTTSLSALRQKIEALLVNPEPMIWVL